MKNIVKIILFAIGLITIGYFCGSIVDLNPLVSFCLFFVFTCMFVYSYANVFKLYNELNYVDENDEENDSCALNENATNQTPLLFYMDFVYPGDEEQKEKEEKIENDENI